MGNLMTSLLNTANGLTVLSRALNVTENNVVNANTPGYVKQTQVFEARPFDLSVGLPGGVAAGPMISARDAFAEQTVREQQSAVNYYTPQASALTALQSNFDLSSSTSISSSLNSFFQSFSQLSVNPNDAVSRQTVLNQASQLAHSFRQTALGLQTQSADVGSQITSTVNDINGLASTIAQINSESRIDPNGGVDAGVDAKLHSTLENLSQLAGITVLQQPNGQVNVYLGGQTALVVGDRAYAIQADMSTAQTAVLDSSGKDVTGQVASGQLGGLLNVKNNSIPSYLADLDTLAQDVADQVNAALSAGIDQNGSAPVTDLFGYDATNGAAATMAANEMTPDQIAAALPGSSGGNGNALTLAALGSSKNISGYTYAQFYGNLAARVGRDSSQATDSQNTEQDLLTQAQNTRSQESSVSLDEEATHLIAFQRSYQAVSKLLTVLDSITDTLIHIIP